MFAMNQNQNQNTFIVPQTGTYFFAIAAEGQ